MTVIAGIVGKNRAVLAADTMASTGWAKFQTDTKLHEKGEVVLGFAGNTNYIRPIRNALPCQRGGDRESVFEWCYDLQTSIREHAAEAGIETGEDAYIILLVSPSGMFVLTGDGAVDVIDQGYFAIGSGGTIALGALSVLNFANDALVESALLEAVTAAGKHDPYCGGRIDIMGVEWGKA